MSLNYMGRYFQQKTNTPLEYPVSAPEGAPNYILKGAKAYFERAPSMLKGGRSTPRPPPGGAHGAPFLVTMTRPYLGHFFRGAEFEIGA